jgi:DNA-binding SARP family transcriptional activator
MPTQLAIRLLGPPQLQTPHGRFIVRRRQPLALLAYLALAAHPTPRETLALLFWSNYDDATARGRLRRVLHELSSALRAQGLSADLLQVEGDTVQLNLNRCDLDTLTFTRLAAADDPAALACYRGQLLDGFVLADAPEFEAWLLATRDRFALLHVALLDRLAEAAARRGDLSEATLFAQQLVAADPLNEDAHVRLAELLAAGGSIGLALRQYEQLRGLLRTELDADPLPETTARLEHLLRRGGRRQERPLTQLPQEPLVGRLHEQAALSEAFARARATGLHSVLLEGVSGVGKTRLIEEWLAGLLASSEYALTLLHVRCHKRLADAPYRAVAEALADRLAPHDNPFLQPAPAGETTEAYEELRFWERLFAALRRLALQQHPASVQAPLLLVIDDVEWIDHATLRALPYLLRRLSAREPNGPACLLLIAGHNPEQLFPIADTLRSVASPGALTLICLAPLCETELDELVRTFVGSPHATLSRRLFQASGGLPFVAVEMLRELRLSGALATANPDDVALPLPQNVQAAVVARLQRLAASVRRLAEIAAVLGPAIELDLLRRVAEQDEEATVEQLEQLEQAGLIVTRDGACHFAHSIIWTILCERLSEARRRLLHRRAARVLAEAPPPHLVGSALLHAQHAQEWELAFRAARCAAQQARHVAALADAIAYEQAAIAALDKLGAAAARRIEPLFAYEQDAHLLGRRESQAAVLAALAALPAAPEQQATLLHRRGRYLATLGHLDEARVQLERGLALDALGQDVQFVMQLELAQVVSQQGDTLRAQELALQARRMAQAAEKTAHELQALLVLAQIAQQAEQTAQSLVWLQLAQPLVTTHSDLHADLLLLLARTHARRDSHELMLEYASEAERLARSQSRVRLQADCLRLQGIAAGRLHRFGEAESAYYQAARLYAALADTRGSAAVTLNLAIVRYRVADFAAAYAAASEAYTLAVALPDLRGQGLSAVNLAAITLMLGDGVASEAWARCALAAADTLDLPLLRAVAGANLAGALLHQRRLDEACERFTRTLAERPPEDVGQITDHTWLAFVWLQLGNFEAAEWHSAVAEQALSSSPGIDIPQQVYAVRALVLHTRADTTGAAAALSLGRHTLAAQLRRMPCRSDRRRYLRNLATNRFLRAARRDDWASEHPLF